VSFKAFKLPHRPSQKHPIDVSEPRGARPHLSRSFTTQSSSLCCPPFHMSLQHTVAEEVEGLSMHERVRLLALDADLLKAWPKARWRPWTIARARARSRRSRSKPRHGWGRWHAGRRRTSVIRTNCGRRGFSLAMPVSMGRRRSTLASPTWRRGQCARFWAKKPSSRTRWVHRLLQKLHLPIDAQHLGHLFRKLRIAPLQIVAPFEQEAQ
jgi:hypothetical protein